MKRILLMMMLIGCAYGGEPDGLLVTDFSSRPLSFEVVNDSVMGGRSEGGFVIEEGILRFRGTTNTDGGGFSSIRSKPRNLGLEGRAAIRLRVRGDGRTWRFRLDAGDPRAAWWADFPTRKGEWTEVRLPFDSFVARFRGRPLDLPPPEPAAIVGVGFMIYDRRDGPFQLEVDWIRAQPPFDLGDLRWKKRPLVVFGRSADEPKLKRQLERVRQDRAAGEERHMTLVVAAPGHGLSSAERRALRERLGVEEETSFLVCLVGKDGTVKRRSSEPVEMAGIFALIDSMPMRRNEMGAAEEVRSRIHTRAVVAATIGLIAFLLLLRPKRLLDLVAAVGVAAFLGQAVLDTFAWSESG